METFQKRVPRGREGLGQHERLAEQTAAHLINGSCRYPIDVIKHTQASKEVMYGVTGIAGLLERSLDDEAACLIGRRRAADVMVALD